MYSDYSHIILIQERRRKKITFPFREETALIVCKRKRSCIIICVCFVPLVYHKFDDYTPSSAHIVKLIHSCSTSVSDPSNRSDDGAFDIITEEEVNGVYDSDTTSQTISLDGERQAQAAPAM